MRLGIDASNIRSGGGITHLVELLGEFNPESYGFEDIVIWAGKATLDQFGDRPWLIKQYDPVMDKNYVLRALWQRTQLQKKADSLRCDLLFIPGGAFATKFRPIVTMSRNLLPFIWKELWRYGLSRITTRLILLRWTQSISFRKAEGIIFLTKYAKDTVEKVTGNLSGKTTTIPHGISNIYFAEPREQRSIHDYSEAEPYRILYVSGIEMYKHQWHVAEAIAQLRKKGFPVVLQLAGPSYPPALARLKETLSRIDSKGAFVRYSGNTSKSQLKELYNKADLNVFASSCENMPNILLEAMASGLPIACSSHGPMPEVLKDAGLYFDPENPVDIAATIQKMIESPELRSKLAGDSFRYSKTFSWQRCADETFSFLAAIARTQSGLSLSR